MGEFHELETMGGRNSDQLRMTEFWMMIGFGTIWNDYHNVLSNKHLCKNIRNGFLDLGNIRTVTNYLCQLLDGKLITKLTSPSL